MIKKLLHTPEGVRDIYGKEYAKKLYIENKLHETLKSFGYEDIQTPTFEFFDVYSKDIGTTPSNELYKFFDKEGNTLVLRPDFTPSIARCAAKYFLEESHFFCHGNELIITLRTAEHIDNFINRLVCLHSVKCLTDDSDGFHLFLTK